MLWGPSLLYLIERVVATEHVNHELVVLGDQYDEGFKDEVHKLEYGVHPRWRVAVVLARRRRSPATGRGGEGSIDR